MKKYIGIWIDHRKALIVTLPQEKPFLQKIDSGVKPHFHFSGGYRSAVPSKASVVSEKTIEERQKHELKAYYKKVIKHLEGADKILIFGPGEAKFEIEKELREIKRFAGKIAGVESADKMTGRAIITKVKEFFSAEKDRRN